MVLVAFQFVLLGVIGGILLWLLPADQFGSVLVTVAALGVASSLVIGAIVRWIVRE